jgi:hypothetical protein
MALKVLSGLLTVSAGPGKYLGGNATIDFEPISVTDDAALGVHVETGDGVGREYSAPPVVILFPTNIVDPGGVPFTWSVTHTPQTREEVQVSWATGGLEIHELAFLVIGMTH